MQWIHARWASHTILKLFYDYIAYIYAAINGIGSSHRSWQVSPVGFKMPTQTDNISSEALLSLCRHMYNATKYS